jgi:hypothetical protein
MRPGKVHDLLRCYMTYRHPSCSKMPESSAATRLRSYVYAARLVVVVYFRSRAGVTAGRPVRELRHLATI